MTSKRKSSKPDFEAALKDLESVVERLEEGDLPLEESVKEWERGIKLQESCETVLRSAEQKVDVLLKKSGGIEVESFTDDDD